MGKPSQEAPTALASGAQAPEQRAQVGRTRGRRVLGHVRAAGEPRGSCGKRRQAGPGRSSRPGPSGTPTGTTEGPPLAVHQLPEPTLTASAALAALAGRAALTGAGHPGNRARGARGQGPGGLGLQTSETPAVARS